MQLISVLVSLLASASLVAALPGGDKSTTKQHLTTACHTTSTCKAIYTTYPEVKKTPVVKTYTTTVYKPETKTTKVPSAYPTTVYCRCLSGDTPWNALPNKP